MVNGILSVEVSGVVGKARNIAFDICKGIAIYAVVMIHLETVLSWRIPTETVAMPTFFFISGYFFSKYFLQSDGGEIDQFFKKCKRLLLPFLVWSSVAFVFNLALEVMVKGTTSDFSEIIRFQAFDIFVHARSLWFLICLFFTFSFTLLCHYFGRLIKPHRKYTGAALAVIGYVLLYMFVFDSVESSVFRFFKFQWLYPYFLLGCVIKRELVESCLEFACRHRIMFLLTALCVLSLMYTLYNERMYSLWCEPNIMESRGGVWILALYYLLGTAGVFLLLGLSGIISKSTNVGLFLSDVGQYSLDVYVMHMFFVKALFILMPQGFAASGLYAYGVAPLLGAAIVVVTYLLAKKVFSKISAYRYLMR